MPELLADLGVIVFMGAAAVWLAQLERRLKRLEAEVGGGFRSRRDVATTADLSPEQERETRD